MGLFLSQKSRGVVIRTRIKCRVAEITYARIDRLLDNELKDYAKAFLFAIGTQLSQRLRQTSRKVGHLAFLDVTGRIAGTLLDLCKQPDAMTHPDGMQIRVTRQEIGRIVGMLPRDGRPCPEGIGGAGAGLGQRQDHRRLRDALGPSQTAAGLASPCPVAPRRRSHRQRHRWTDTWCSRCQTIRPG